MMDAGGLVEAAAGAGIAMYALGGMNRAAADVGRSGSPESEIIGFASDRGYELVERDGGRLVFERRGDSGDFGFGGGL